MIFREATIHDIDGIMAVRFSVLENVLRTPGLVTEKDCEEYLTQRGKGWVCAIEHRVVGFSIADLQENNIWALFVRPEQEWVHYVHQAYELVKATLPKRVQKTVVD